MECSFGVPAGELASHQASVLDRRSKEAVNQRADKSHHQPCMQLTWPRCVIAYVAMMSHCIAHLAGSEPLEAVVIGLHECMCFSYQFPFKRHPLQKPSRSVGFSSLPSGNRCLESYGEGCRKLYDVFINIRDDDMGHVKTIRWL
jgi:hypothetical protein